MKQPALACAHLGLTLFSHPLIAMDATAGRPAQAEPAALRLRLKMRLLWEEHISYTRGYIVSALAGLQDAPSQAKRLLLNQDEIGEAFMPYYGRVAGKRLAALLREHILIATEVVARAKAADKAGLAKAQAKWQANGGELTDFLSKANPNWQASEVSAMLAKHLELTTGEVAARLGKDWAVDIAFADQARAHMMAYADYLADGIARQFPGRFPAAP